MVWFSITHRPDGCRANSSGASGKGCGGFPIVRKPCIETDVGWGLDKSCLLYEYLVEKFMARYFITRDGHSIVAEATDFTPDPPPLWQRSTISNPSAGLVSFTSSQFVPSDSDGTLGVVNEQGVAWIITPAGIDFQTGQSLRMTANYEGETLDVDVLQVGTSIRAYLDRVGG